MRANSVQMQTNVDKRKQMRRRNANKRKHMRANMDKRKQTQTNAYTPLYCNFLHPFAIPLSISCVFFIASLFPPVPQFSMALEHGAICCAPKLPESRCERILFHGSWNLSRVFFKEISCAHFFWKLKDENRRIISPIFRCIFRPCRRNISPDFRSRGLSANI